MFGTELRKESELMDGRLFARGNAKRRVVALVPAALGRPAVYLALRGRPAPSRCETAAEVHSAPRPDAGR